ncbi:60S ribosomal protein L9B [Mitosporidium daphniae]|uniref:Large ribosomal subunit protein uL6 alpha-beta domain-containing protein n=1 Tax=Mitosporidium daphniae TaxID=1485682 RepID=A0A098VLP7_9MICR|nr:uncharacterized protein DI09_93p80 [Mitosporidium daphniae]KGG50022.1 hypothetical protein DI09_93p80 [Mitosporidium daphniae]|eukprot:XP_013236458.1 uncharacterized protein DI09_93p80 [Mitosporidium daphniae]
MKSINTSININIPSGVTLTTKARLVTVTGPRGTLSKDFKHVDIEMQIINSSTLRLQVWFGLRKHNAVIRTVATHIENMIKGVTKGFQYKMKSVYAHFPININIAGPSKNLVEIRNFLGEKAIRRISMLEGVSVSQTGIKDEIMLVGNSIDNVSQSAANIQQSTNVTDKDVRKFLDGIYVSERGVIKAKNE